MPTNASPPLDGTWLWLLRDHSFVDLQHIEAERIEHQLKWSPVKVFTSTIPRGIGKSSNWRMFVSSHR
jgi:hypothetical protein